MEERRAHLWRVNFFLRKKQSGPITVCGVGIIDQVNQAEKICFSVVAASQRLISIDERL